LREVVGGGGNGKGGRVKRSDGRKDKGKMGGE
jgi:hypothetical protein